MSAMAERLRLLGSGVSMGAPAVAVVATGALAFQDMEWAVGNVLLSLITTLRNLSVKQQCQWCIRRPDLGLFHLACNRAAGIVVRSG